MTERDELDPKLQALFFGNQSDQLSLEVSNVPPTPTKTDVKRRKLPKPVVTTKETVSPTPLTKLNLVGINALEAISIYEERWIVGRATIEEFYQKTQAILDTLNSRDVRQAVLLRQNPDIKDIATNRQKYFRWAERMEGFYEEAMRTNSLFQNKINVAQPIISFTPEQPLKEAS
jgi:hypothetical protein